MAHWTGAANLFDHPALGSVKYSTTEVSDDPDTQVAQTIDLMRRYAVEDSRSALVIADAARAWQSGDPIGDTWGYIKSRLQFINDEVTAEPLQPSFIYPIVETLCRPKDMAVAPYPQGDCDDFSMYGAAHLLARGVPCSFATVAANGQDPTAYSHVYLVAYPKTGPYAGKRVPMDLSHGAYPGWEVGNQYGKMREWPCNSTSSVLIIAAIIGAGLLIYEAWRMKLLW
jgi:hypothetical protein